MRRNLLLWLVVATIAFLFPACHNSTGPDDCTKLLVEAYKAFEAMGAPTLTVTLISDDGTTEVPGDEDLSTLRVLISDLTSGTYYIKVTSAAATDQPYAVRVLYPACSEPSPIYPESYDDTDGAYEPDDANIDLNTMSIGNSNYVKRYFDIGGSAPDNQAAPDTVDWLKFVLP